MTGGVDVGPTRKMFSNDARAGIAWVAARTSSAPKNVKVKQVIILPSEREELVIIAFI